VNKSLQHWLLFTILSVIWGSSFILMKIGLDNGLSSWQVASLRIVSSGLVLLPLAIRHFKNIPANKLVYVLLTGVLGSLVPSYLFCIAEEKIDSSLAGTLNALTPIFVIVNGFLFFKNKVSLQKFAGVCIAFAGCLLLLAGKDINNEKLSLFHALLVVLATFSYGINVNLAGRYLGQIPAISLAAVSLSLIAIPAFVVLWMSGYFQLPLLQAAYIKATVASSVLGIAGTAFASVLFYKLLKSAGGVFASMVTYGIPFVAIAWGIYFNENVGVLQCIALLIILAGVYWANRKKE
jgi:drug/metabolite transporter (DMT)-like permease